MYNFQVSENLKKILNKLSKKDKDLYDQVLKKIDEVIHSENIEHYKNLRHDMKDSKRVHIGHFVLVFQYKKKKNLSYLMILIIMIIFTNNPTSLIVKQLFRYILTEHFYFPVDLKVKILLSGLLPAQ